jgi:5-methylcytosine-specific restriction protein B
VKEVVEFEIIPQLFEYWFDNEEKAEQWALELRNSYEE